MKQRSLNQAATRVIRTTYEVGNLDPEPKKILTDIARSISVVGGVVDSLSKDYKLKKSKAGVWFSRIGRFFWGIAELSVPNTVGRYLLVNWVMLAALVSLAIVVIGFFFGQPSMLRIGLAMLVLTFVVYQLSNFCHRFMITARPPWKIAWITLGLITLASGLYLAHIW